MDLDCYHVAAGLFNASVSEGANRREAAAAKEKQQPKNPPKEKKESAGRRRRPRKQKAPEAEGKERRSSGRRRDFLNFLCLRESLGYLALLVPAYAFAQSYVGGAELAHHQGPYGLPAREFADFAAAATPASNRTFPISGYNTSLPAADSASASASADDDDDDAAMQSTTAGWSLNIRVLANVPLANSSSAAIYKALYMDATALTVTPPAGVGGFDGAAWRVCAVVFAGGLRAGGATRADGGCGGLLAQDCIDQLRANGLANRAGRTGGCRDLEVPTNCAVHFNGLTGTGYEITPIGNGSLPDRGSMFFASGFEPARRGNATALAAAERRVWPVLMTWTHFDEAGAVAGSAGWLSCAKTNDSKELAETPSLASTTVTREGWGLAPVVWVVLLWLSMLVW